MGIAHPHTRLPPNEVCHKLEQRLASDTQGELKFDAETRVPYAPDASIYQIMPVGVFEPRTEDDVATSLTVAAELMARLRALGEDRKVKRTFFFQRPPGMAPDHLLMRTLDSAPAYQDHWQFQDRRDDLQLAAAVRAMRDVDLESEAAAKTNLYPSHVKAKTRLSNLAQLSRTGR